MGRETVENRERRERKGFVANLKYKVYNDDMCRRYNLKSRRNMLDF